MQVPDIQTDVLFGNMEEVSELSGELLKALEETCQEKCSPVGQAFVTFAPRIKEVYGIYCRNHDNAVSLYEKVRSVMFCFIMCNIMIPPVPLLSSIWMHPL